MPELHDEHLVQRCLGGDRAAFGTLVDRYQTLVYNAAYRITRDSEDARDVTQAVFVKVFERLDSYRPEFKFSSWLYKIAVNEAIDVVNRRNAHVALDPAMIAGGPSPEDLAVASQMSVLLQDSMMDLDVRSRVLVVLRHFAGLSYRELGFVLDVPEKTVKSRLFEARRLLARLLAQRGVFAHE